MPGEFDTIRIIDINKSKEDIAQLIQALGPLKTEITNLSNLSIGTKPGGGVGIFKQQAQELKEGMEQIANVQTKIQTAVSGTSTKFNTFTENAKLLKQALADTKTQLEGLNKAGQAQSETAEKLSQQAEVLNALVNQQAKGFSSLTMEIRSSERALQSMRQAGLQNTEAFKQMQMQAANTRREFNEFQKSQRLLASEAPAITALTMAAKGLAGAYAVGAGASALLAQGNEKVEKELNKLVAIMTVLQGLEEFNQLIKQRGAIATAIYTAAQKLWNATAMESVAATLAVRGALIAATGGILLLLPLLMELKDQFDKTTKSEKELNEMFEKAAEPMAKATQEIAEMKQEIQLAKDGFLAKDRVTEHYNETLGKTMGSAKDLAGVEKMMTEKAAAYIKMTYDKAIATEAYALAAKKVVDIELQRAKGVDKEKIQAAAAAFGLTEEAYHGVQKAQAQMNKSLAEEQKDADQLTDIALKYERAAAKEAEDAKLDFFGGQFKPKPDKLEQIKDAVKKYVHVTLEALNHEVKVNQLSPEAGGMTDSLLHQFLGLSAAAANINFLQNPTVKNHEKLLDILKAIDQEGQKDKLHNGVISEVQYNEALLQIDKKYADERRKIELESIDQGFAKIQGYVQEGEKLISGIVNADITNRRNALQKIEDLQQKNYENEVARINSSTLTQQQKAAELIALEAKRQIQKEQNERRNRQIEQERARFQKAEAITNIVLNTAKAVVDAYIRGLNIADKVAGAAVAAAVGSAELAVAIAQPIPQYKRGTMGSPGGLALVHPGELRVEPTGQMSMTPNKPSLTYMKRGTKIIPAEEVNRMIFNGMIKQTAQMSEDDKTAQKIEELKEAINAGSRAQVSAIKKQKTSTTVIVNGDFNSYIEKTVRS